jgi:hypothetical protein
MAPHANSTPARPPTVEIMRKLGLKPDPWQAAVLETACPRLLLNCCRQAGKSTVVALLGLVETLWTPGHQVILLSRSHRQSKELFRIIGTFYRQLGAPAKRRHTAFELELTNLSRIVCLPCKEDTIRGYSGVNLLVIDEAARVPDNVYRAVRPMLAVSDGRLICLSTPRGKLGFFYDAWAGGDPDWLRIEVPATRVPRIKQAFLEQERRALGQSWFQQEYWCSFEAMEGLVYPDFAHCVAREVPANLPRRVGGIDFGYRNPFAAVWGSLDHDDVLWITGEHYEAGRVMSYHAARLPRDVGMWYTDPSGAQERAELIRADFKVRPGNNAVQLGLAAVAARVENGTLRIQEGRCPNLLREAQLYRYEAGGRHKSEVPLEENNHAMDALRYLVMGLDEHRLARPQPAPDAPPPPPPRPQPRKWLRYDNEELWTRLI